MKINKYLTAAITLYFSSQIALSYIEQGMSTKCSDNSVIEEIIKTYGRKYEIISIVNKKDYKSYREVCIATFDNSQTIEFVINNNNGLFTLMHLMKPFGINVPILTAIDAEFR